MNRSERDRAYEASKALASAAEEVHRMEEDFEVLPDLQCVQWDLEATAGGLGSDLGEVCKSAAFRLSMIATCEEVETLQSEIRSRLAKEAAQLIQDADNVLQLKLPLGRKPRNSPSTDNQ